MINHRCDRKHTRAPIILYTHKLREGHIPTSHIIAVPRLLIQRATQTRANTRIELWLCFNIITNMKKLLAPCKTLHLNHTDSTKMFLLAYTTISVNATKRLAPTASSAKPSHCPTIRINIVVNKRLIKYLHPTIESSAIRNNNTLITHTFVIIEREQSAPERETR